jgi:prepilin signal peptidase PulO-like enzyme (type II secretory pathway)
VEPDGWRLAADAGVVERPVRVEHRRLARIVCTLLFGKEALGMGDIHILAAAGAVAGWPVPFLGFFLAAPLTLVAIGIIALRRQSRALPYGPWLALAFLIVTVFQDRILHYLGVRWMLSASPSGLPDVLP